MSFLVVLRKLRERWLGNPARAGKRRRKAGRPGRVSGPGYLEVEPLEERTLLSTYFVDATNTDPVGVQDGTQQHPFATIQQAMALANGPASTGPDGQPTGLTAPDTILVYGNGASVAASTPYVWRNVPGSPIQDGNITVTATNVAAGNFDTLVFRSKVLDRTGTNPDDGPAAPVVVKLQGNIIDVEGELRAEGSPVAPVVFTSYFDRTAGGVPAGTNNPLPNRRDWGGIRFRGTAVDMGPDETTGSLINYADIRFTGAILPDPELAINPQTGTNFTTEFGSVRMEYTGPDRTLTTTSFNEADVSKVRVENTTFRSGGRALDVDFWALAGSLPPSAANVYQNFKNLAVTGPDIRNITFDVSPVNPALVTATAQGNTINGLYVDIPPAPNVPNFKGLHSEWDDVGIPYVLTQRLNVTTDEATGVASVLTIDAGMVIKDSGSEIWAAGDTVSHGGTLNVNGTAAKPVFFTSLNDDAVENDPRIASLYSNGSQDTDNDLAAGGSPVNPAPGDWGGITIADGHIDHAVITYGGGSVLRPQNLFTNGGPLRTGGPFSAASGLNGPFFPAGGPTYNAGPLTISNGFDSVVPGGYGVVRVSNTEITKTAASNPNSTGTVRGAIMAVGSGQTDVIDNWVHDNPMAAIYTWGVGTYSEFTNGNGPDTPSVYNTNPDPLGGFGIHIEGNLVAGNTNNGVVTDNVGVVPYREPGGNLVTFGIDNPTGTTGYIDNTDIAQTILNQINVSAVNQTVALLSQRAALPTVNLDKFQGDATALAAFLTEVPGILPNGGTSATLVNPGSSVIGDNDFFTRFINFETTARGQAVTGAAQEDTGNLTGEEWRDDGVELIAPSGSGYMPLKATTPQPAGNLFTNTTAAAIPDDPTTPLTSTITVNNSFTVNAVSVQVSITHPRDSDLRLELVHNGITVRLVNQAGGFGANFDRTTFADGALQKVNDATAPFFGTFVPEQPLSAFAGASAQGDWQLRVTDLVTGATGVLNNWSLRFTSSDLSGTGDPDPFAPVSGNNILTTAEPAKNSTLEMIFQNQVSAVGFWVVGANVVGPNDKIDYFDAAGNLVAEQPFQAPAAGATPDQVRFFAGVVSKTPIYRVVITKDPAEQVSPGVPDTIGIDDLYFVRAGQNLVVKMAPSSTVSAGGYVAQDVDSNGNLTVGGTLRVMGTTANPVVLTSLADDTVAAGALARRPNIPGGPNLTSTYAADNQSAVQADTNGNGASTGAPGDWTGVQIKAGANSSQIENAVQQASGTIVRRAADYDPYTIGDDLPAAALPPGSIAGTSSTTDQLVINASGPENGNVPPQQNLQDGTLVEHADIRFATTGVDSSAYPNSTLSLEGTETDGRENSASANGDNNTRDDANQLLQIITNSDGDIAFPTYNGADRVEGRLVTSDDEDFWALPQTAGTNNTGGIYGISPGIYIQVDNTGAPLNPTSPFEGVGIWVFNAFQQLIYANAPNLTATTVGGTGAPIQGMSGFLGGFGVGSVMPTGTYPGAGDQGRPGGVIHLWAGDEPFVLTAGGHRDAAYIVITGAGRDPSVLHLPNGPFPVFTPLAVDPVTGRATGFAVSFTGSLTSPLSFVDNPQNDSFSNPSLAGFPLDAEPNNPFGGYEMEVRAEQIVNGVDIHASPRGQAVRVGQQGQIILRENVIEDAKTAAVSLHDNLNTVTASDGLTQTVPTQTARYFYPNDNINTNTGLNFTNQQDLIQGLSVYNNVIRLSQGAGITIADSTTQTFDGTLNTRLSAESSLVASGYHLIFNNTIDANQGDGIAVTSRGGSYVFNNLLTNNGGFGVNVNDTGDVHTQDNLTLEPPVYPALATVDFNQTFKDAGGDFNGPFGSTGPTSRNITGQDPQYVNEPAGDYRILETSPAVDSAISDVVDRLSAARNPNVPALAPNDDFRNRPRHDDPLRTNVGGGSQPFYDRGAFEAPLLLQAVPDFYTTANNVVLDVPAPGVLQNDIGADPNTGEKLVVTASSTVSSLGAAVAVDANGHFTYNPLTSPTLQALAPGATATDTFAYQVTNSEGDVSQTTVTVTVTGGTPTPPPGGPGPGPTPTPQPPGLVSPASLVFVPGKLRRLANGTFVQTVTAFNVGSQPIQMPLALVLVGLSRKVTLLNRTGISRVIAPGAPYQLLALPSAVLNSFQGATFTLRYRSPSAKLIRPMYFLSAGTFNI